MPLASLKPGDRIAIISPARHAPPAWFEKAKQAFAKHQLELVIHPQNLLRHHQLAGNDAARAKALMDVFADPTIHAVMCARGGLGSYRLLPLLDYAKLSKHPKIFCGFSDITTLLHALYKKTGMPTFHGPVLWNFSNAPDAQVMENLLGVLQNKLTKVRQSFTQGTALRTGKGEGKLVGGNITLIQNLMGTEYDVSTDGGILFIEDTEERASQTDRALHHLAYAGKFARIKGLIVGEFTHVKEEESGPWGEKLADTLLKLAPPGIPIITNFPCGHGRMLATFPIGVKTALEVKADGTGLTFLESPFG